MNRTRQTQLTAVIHGTTNPAAAQAAKTAGMAEADAHTGAGWAADCDNAIATMARRGLPFQAADLIEQGLVDEPDHPAQWGPRFGAAARAGTIRHHGYAPSKRATVHKSICKTWIGAEAAAGEVAA
ncbi:hypothetical protein MTQ13_03300 [Streptomyces sp. XM4011]|uniref:hypothetical protein n=1 Tax=Streptomyces sp. XM4011 TaxID=2929780 RepID=UPI001FF96C7A|nr:hypothetical protein [Streptomyces sp. XM4011]MCK1813308.1 hypothetical protein [Streptomyces sp. XM4011]